jgi:putative ATPase
MPPFTGWNGCSAGDDPYYMLRRMIRFATEDIGMADPGALTMALNASDAFRIAGPS